MIFGDHIYCQCSQQNIFQHFNNYKKNQKFPKNLKVYLFFLKNQKLLSSETIGESANTNEIWDFFLNVLNISKCLNN